MSGTVTPPTPVAPAQEQLVTPQTIIALIGMMIVAGTVMAVFWRGTSDNVSMAIGFVFGSMGSGIVRILLRIEQRFARQGCRR